MKGHVIDNEIVSDQRVRVDSVSNCSFKSFNEFSWVFCIETGEDPVGVYFADLFFQNYFEHISLLIETEDFSSFPYELIIFFDQHFGCEFAFLLVFLVDFLFNPDLVRVVIECIVIEQLEVQPLDVGVHDVKINSLFLKQLFNLEGLVLFLFTTDGDLSGNHTFFGFIRFHDLGLNCEVILLEFLNNSQLK